MARELLARAGRAATRTGRLRPYSTRTREEWRAFASEHDGCLEPVLELDEALESDLVRAREMVLELDQPGARRRVRLLDVPVNLRRTPGDAAGLRTVELKREGAISDMTPPPGRASAWWSGGLCPLFAREEIP